MFIDTIPNRKSPPAVLLRESYREGGRVKKRTLANLSKLPQALMRALPRCLMAARSRVNAQQNPASRLFAVCRTAMWLRCRP